MVKFHSIYIYTWEISSSQMTWDGATLHITSGIHKNHIMQLNHCDTKILQWLHYIPLVSCWCALSTWRHLTRLLPAVPLLLGGWQVSWLLQPPSRPKSFVRPLAWHHPFFKWLAKRLDILIAKKCCKIMAHHTQVMQLMKLMQDASWRQSTKPCLLKLEGDIWQRKMRFQTRSGISIS